MAAEGVLEILRDIEADILRNAAPLPLKRDTRPEWQGLGFQVSGVRLVAPLSEVSEILTPPRVTPLPRVKDWMLGIANVRGRLIPIIDLHRFMGIATTVPRAQWRVLVVEQGETVAGLVVEQSLGMQHFLDDSFEEGRPEGLEPIHDYIQGAYRHGGRVFYVVSLTSLIRDEKFNDVAN
jgi:twitching motility protein PilI